MTRLAIDPALRREIEAVFEAAIERPRAERGAWVAERCASDPRLLAEVSALIAGHERAEGILERRLDTAALEAIDAPGKEDAAQRIGPYRVVRELGRGGMGVVYLAERDDGQYRQQVAVKVLRESPDAGQSLRLFLGERQILASLAHPGIARLLDGGISQAGRPYLVMECVDGVPITTYCEQRKLDLDARLRLFRDVCDAVHYAHQNLVLHRDIKPGNILVSADGRVKLLDFGIAKLLSPVRAPGDAAPVPTAFRPMTPEYASPEQVGDKVLTTASDVYALGVVLFELLAGRRPYYLTTASPQELTTLVCEREPPLPSSVAPFHLRHLLRGDLDAIVMRALRKDANARYTSADLLAQDVQRYFDGLPVLAHRGSRLYRARKFLGRHRGQAVAAALVLLSLATGAGLAFRQATVARRALADAEQSLRQSESVTGFLVGLFDATAPKPGGPITADELVRQGAALLATLDGQPLMQARMLEAMGRVHVTMGRYLEARAALERSFTLRLAQLGPDHAEVAASLLYLGEVLRRTGEYRQADSVTRRALAIRTAAFGPEHPLTADVLAQLAGLAVYLSNFTGAEELSRQALAIRRASLHPTDRLIGVSLELHAAHLRRMGRLDDAVAELREAVALNQAIGGAESPDAAYLQLRLADLVLEAKGDTTEAESLMRSGLAATRGALGEDHIRTAWAMGDLAGLLSKRGQHAEAETLARRALAIGERAAGADHPSAAGFHQLLTVVHRRAERFPDAEAASRRNLAIIAASLGTSHAAYASALSVSSELLLHAGRHDEAIAERRRVMKIRRAAFGEGGALEGIDLAKLARIHARKGDYATADSLFSAALVNQLLYVPETHPDVREIYDVMAERYRLEGRSGEAERYARMAQPR